MNSTAVIQILLTACSFGWQFLHSYKQAVERERRPIDSNTRSRWGRPSIGQYKINFDGAVFKEQGAIGVEVDIRDHDGKFIAGVSKLIRGPCEAVVAEALAAREAISLLR
ncbi:hypothetical protein ACH5RR_027549 [Cinchona calisaya]|uniref:RNase H type-1 domain-containing protein n=1 Tax=Cinchona calisaya TaxID=153742 RepID=A0ABD2Z9N1_9GENT